MKKLLLFTFLISGLNLFAIELNYNWKPGTAYTFNGTIVDNISTSMMGMNVQDKYTTSVDFVLAIQSVDGEGTASGTLYLINFNVKNSKGVSVASLLNLPKNSVKSEVKVDRKGNFEFLREIHLLTTPTSNVLVYANATESGVSGGVNTGEEKVEAYAEFDPKTGKLKAGYSVTALKPKKVTVKENDESDELDVIPYDLLEFLLLPEGDVNQGDQVRVQAGMYICDFNMLTVTPTLVSMKERIATDKNADMFGGGANGNTGEGSFNMGFGGAEEMEMEEEDKAVMNDAKAMMPTITGDITSNFDPANGIFLNAKGTVTSTMDYMGMKMTVVSNFDFKKK